VVHNSSAGPVTVTLDADGYWLAGAPAVAGAFGPLAGGQVASVLVGGGQTVTVPVAGQAGVPASGAGAVALAVGTAGGGTPGRVSVYPAGGGGPAEPGLSGPGLSGPGPGLAALNAGGDAQVTSISCASAGNCSAGGYYTDSGGNTQAFVVSEVNGTWGTAIEVPGTDTPEESGLASVNAMSCSSAGDCGAVGTSGGPDAVSGLGSFVVSEVNGTWGTAADLLVGASVSCPSDGNCSAGGDGGYVASEVDGSWGAAAEVPGLDTVSSVSCWSAGDCAAYGSSGAPGQQQVFAASEVNGT
jgi:hypothetical protein